MNLSVSFAMLPLLVVALMIWAGIFVFLLVVERKVTAMERTLDALRTSRGGGNS